MRNREANIVDRIASSKKSGMTGESREERIAGNLTHKVLAGKSWSGARAMREDIEAMAEMMRVWTIREQSEVDSGRARFNYAPYYGYILDALEECAGKLQKMEGRV